LTSRRGRIGTDTEAGPTEIAIVADHTADPALVAADLVAQAEHDPLAACLLITTDPGLADRVDAELARGPGGAARRPDRAALAGQSGCVLVADIGAALAVADAWAPEHLEIQAEHARNSRPGSITLARCSSGHTRRSRWAIISRDPTTCCRPGEPRGTPAGSRCSPSCGARAGLAPLP
jgi:histidinol dehydrogenase